MTAGPKGECEAILTRGGRICARGTAAELAVAADEIRDIEGRCLCPAFIECHAHPRSGGELAEGLDLSGVESRGGLTAAIKAHAAANPGKEWIIGRGWKAENWPDGHPGAQTIDEALGGRLGFFTRADAHAAICGNATLKACGIDRGAEVDGGVVEKDDSGNPTGFLKEKAMELVRRHIPAASNAELRGFMERALREAAANGIGTMHAIVSLREFEALREIRRKGRLSCRIIAYIWPDREKKFELSWSDRLEKSIALAAATKEDDFLRLAGMKFFHDGSLGSRTALFFTPYIDNPGFSGLSVIDDHEEMRARLRAVVDAGLQPMVHAIGDQAVHECVEWFSNSVPPPRIEHAQHLAPGEAAAMAAKKIAVSMQPSHMLDDAPLCEKILGADRCALSYPLRSLLDAGVVMGFGTDWPVVPLDPMVGIYLAASRRARGFEKTDGWIPEQRISVTEAFAAYTIGGAVIEGSDSWKGRLALGYAADFAILSQDPRRCEVHEIPAIKITETIVDGDTVFTR